ncbi:MAG TPA: sulfurtransferase [Candidatus Limnocylindrales bacterium]|nr:sulfurtransferase [Candidatus Limnocylindrales bacterium]
MTVSLSGPLIDVATLADAIHDPLLRVVDCRWYLGKPGEGRRAYDAGHLPAAMHLDIDSDLTAPAGPGRHPLPDPVVFRHRLEGIGIGDEHTVVAYDDVGGWVAARLWWMLDDLGHQAVAVLDGGIGAWTASGLPLSKEEPAHHRALLSLRGTWGRVVDRDELRAGLGSLRVLDARAAARYRGEIEPIDAYPGHIPTAISAPTDGNLAPDGRFLAPSELAARYRELRADGSLGEVIVSCGSGVSATHDALALRIAGLPDARLYPGSYSDWTQQGWPVATGPEPGEPNPS